VFKNIDIRPKKQKEKKELEEFINDDESKMKHAYEILTSMMGLSTSSSPSTAAPSSSSASNYSLPISSFPPSSSSLISQSDMILPSSSHNSPVYNKNSNSFTHSTSVSNESTICIKSPPPPLQPPQDLGEQSSLFNHKRTERVSLSPHNSTSEKPTFEVVVTTQPPVSNSPILKELKEILNSPHSTSQTSLPSVSVVPVLSPSIVLKDNNNSLHSYSSSSESSNQTMVIIPTVDSSMSSLQEVVPLIAPSEDL
jgi:hypothetical protein